jgi:putative ABC transport system ATP-binding protein
MENPFIQISDLRKEFIMGDVTVKALNGAELTMRKDDLMVVMGPSGSGKSTLLYLLGGLDRPTSGKIQVESQSIDSLDENALAVYRREKVGFIFQSFNLISSMTALDNVAFPMRFAGVPRRERIRRAYALLKQVGLEDRVLHKPTELSGGQQQRVAVARSLVNNPQLILADEPTGNLDTASGAGIMQLLSDLHKEGRTVMVVTHDPRMAQFATRIVHLLDGQVVPEGEYASAAALAV